VRDCAEAPANSPPGEALLRLAGVSKSFGSQRALDEASLELHAGEVCALIGENGSGKSTLIKILSGFHRAEDGGQAWFRGDRVPLDDHSHQWRQHMRFVHQDLGLIPNMSVLDNLALTAGYQTGVGGRIRWRAEAARARRMLARVGLEGVDLSAPVQALAPVERTLVAIARAIVDWRDESGVLILDEPTTALSRPEVARLFSAIRELAARGTAVLFVSHRLEEALEIADRVVVLRDGRVVAARPLAGLDERSLLAMMVDASDPTPGRPAPASDRRPLLEVRGLSGRRTEGLSFTLHRGEILGFAGVSGSGREEIADLIFGSSRARCGEIVMDGKPTARPAPASSLARGIALVPADRVQRSVIPGFTVRESLTLANLAPLTKAGMIDRAAERRETLEWIGRVGLAPADPDRPVAALSGGNQQKSVLARCLRTSPRVLLLDEPVQGVDVAARRRILTLIKRCAAAGTAVLVCASDAHDLADLCDRVLVMRHGRAVAELTGTELRPRAILAAALASERHTHEIVSERQARALAQTEALP